MEMDSTTKPETLDSVETDERASQAKPRPKYIRPPLPTDFKELCELCRSGKLFAVQEWFKTHKYFEPEKYDRRHCSSQQPALN
jgi:hypothetical protein